MDDAGRLLVDVDGEVRVFAVGDVVHVRAPRRRAVRESRRRACWSPEPAARSASTSWTCWRRDPAGGRRHVPAGRHGGGRARVRRLGLTRPRPRRHRPRRRARAATRHAPRRHRAPGGLHRRRSRRERCRERASPSTSEARRSMSRAAGECDAHLIAISTDYVFDGKKGAAYVEDDATAPAQRLRRVEARRRVARARRATRSCAPRG